MLELRGFVAKRAADAVGYRQLTSNDNDGGGRTSSPDGNGSRVDEGERRCCRRRAVSIMAGVRVGGAWRGGEAPAFSPTAGAEKSVVERELHIK